MHFTDPDGNVFASTYQYNDNNPPQLVSTTTTDDKGNNAFTTSYEYDDSGNLVNTTNTGPTGA